MVSNYGISDDLDHEEPEACPIRETKEELGLNVRLGNFLVYGTTMKTR